MEETFKCDKCGIEPEELCAFSKYGNNEDKIEDDGNYCEECFEQLDRLHSSQ